jgi:hypothetical protein
MPRICIAPRRRCAQLVFMKKPSAFTPFALPMMMAQLTAASWETIFHRSMMMAQGNCSASEYQRMTAEKAAALQASAIALMAGRSQTAVLAPFVSRARANARRLRRS